MTGEKRELAQIDAVLASAPRSFPDPGIGRFNTRALATIERLSPEGSAYQQRANRAKASGLSEFGMLKDTLRALRDDIEAGFMRSFRELVHAELFSDYLEQAEYLNSESYKDPAAVIAGSTLEQHLRALCLKHGTPVQNVKGQNEKADKLNADLAKAQAYSKLEQKQVTAWLGLRNDAAHGNYVAYEKSQVTQMILGIRDFIARHPA